MPKRNLVRVHTKLKEQKQPKQMAAHGMSQIGIQSAAECDSEKDCETKNY